jgi:hypothetical protein
MYVLLTPYKTYFVDYLIGQLILSNSIGEAMEFSDYDTAFKFQTMLIQTCKLETSINTFIK